MMKTETMREFAARVVAARNTDDLHPKCPVCGGPLARRADTWWPHIGTPKCSTRLYPPTMPPEEVT